MNDSFVFTSHSPLLALVALVRGTVKGCFLATLPDP